MLSGNEFLGVNSPLIYFTWCPTCRIWTLWCWCRCGGSPRCRTGTRSRPRTYCSPRPERIPSNTGTRNYLSTKIEQYTDWTLDLPTSEVFCLVHPWKTLNYYWISPFFLSLQTYLPILNAIRCLLYSEASIEVVYLSSRVFFSFSRFLGWRVLFRMSQKNLDLPHLHLILCNRLIIVYPIV